MLLSYTHGEILKEGDVVIWLNQKGEYYQFDQSVMKVWSIAETNDGEIVGVNLIPPSVESPMIMLRRLVRENEPESSSDLVKMKDVPGIYTITRWFLPLHKVSKCLGLIARIEYFTEYETGHGELIQRCIQDKADQYRGIYQYYLADQAYQQRDFQRHIDLLHQSAQSGYTPAMCHLAMHFFNGTLIEKNHEKSKYWYSQAVKKNDALAMYQLAGCYARATGTPQNLKQSFNLLEQSAEAGCWSAIAALAGYYRFGWLNSLLVSEYYAGYEQVDERVLDHQKALRLYLHIATEAPPAEEQAVIANVTYHLGWMYQDGIGTAQDYEQSVHWYRKSAELGNIVAINNLADKYEHGTSVEQDLEMAAALYSDVADRVVAAALSLGRMYFEGRGVEQNLELARHHLNTVIQVRMDGVEEMQAEAMQLLERFTEDSPVQQARKMLKNPDQFTVDDVNAQIRKIDSMLELPEVKVLFFQLYLVNARKGEASSQSQVGDWYLRGVFTEKNLEEAIYWIQKAADQKNYYAEYQMGFLYENGLYYNQDFNLAQKWFERALREPSESYCPEYVNGQLNPEYLGHYQQMNTEALSGLLRLEQKKPKPSKWRFWKK